VAPRGVGSWGDFVVTEQSRTHRPRRRIWVQHVAVEADRLELQLRAARHRELTGRQVAVADGVAELLGKARAAAFGQDPAPRRPANWWRGVLVEAAYQNLHTARAEIVDLYDENELRAEIPTALAKAQSALHRDDPRRVAAEQLLQSPELQSDRVRPILRRLIGDSYMKLDLDHAQLRSFRNIVLLAALSMFVLVAATVGLIAWKPDWLPLCFALDGGAQACPTSTGRTGPRYADIIMVALLGALGGGLTASLSIRNLKGTSTPYDVPVALAMLKVPLGAFTAILALVAIRGNFVPGLSNLDSQEQILAYALVFGFTQQAMSRLLDQRAQTLMEGLPGGTATEPTPAAPPAPPAPAAPSTPGKEAGPEEAAEITPPGELAEDVDVIPAPSEDVSGPSEGEAVLPQDQDAEAALGEAVLAEDQDAEAALGEPMQTPAEQPEPDLLPNQEADAYFEDGQAEEDAGPDAPDGVEYPTVGKDA
jgi:hypothetical protein